MSPLLDLDDDAITTTLGFSDPRTLCAITMTCRRLRVLADAAWVVLEKHIPNDTREGGNTPRERVLSSFVVHERKRWLEDIDLKAVDLQKVEPEKLKTENHLLYVRLTGTESHGNHTVKRVSSFFLNVSDEGLQALAEDKGSTEVPIEKEQLMTGQLRYFVQRTLTILSRSSIHLVRLYERTLAQSIEDVFRNVDIAIVALNRRTLNRYIFFQGEPKVPSYNLPEVRFSGNFETRRVHVDILGAHNWMMSNFDDARMMQSFLTLQFYFKGSEFGLKLSYSRAFF